MNEGMTVPRERETGGGSAWNVLAEVHRRAEPPPLSSVGLDARS